MLKQAIILSDFKSYDFIIKILDKIKINNTKLCNEFTISKIKRNIVDFKFKVALELIDKIDDSNDLYFMLIKANLYKHLGMKELSENQLKSASEFLNISKLEDNKYASAIGYLRLTSISMFGNNNQINSDQGWIENKFNTKTILNKYRENIIEERYKEFHQAFSSYSFNPNTTKHSYNMNFGISNKLKKCFGYLSLIDQLSLGIFSDHQQITIDIMNELESHSESIYYGWYTILMSGNNKIVDQFFTRERVYDADIIEVNHMFDNIYEFIACGIGSIPNKKISILINFLSKLTAVVDVDKIKKLIHFLTQLDKHENEEVKKAIRESLETIKYSFNDEIFLDCLDLLINDALAEYMFPVYFLDFRYQGEKKTEIKKTEISNFIIKKSNSCNFIERANAVALCLIFVNYLSNDSKQEIVHNLMKVKDEFGFPANTNFYPTIWEKVPFFETKDLYNYYLCNPYLTRIYHDGAYFDNGGTLDEIIVYEQILINLLVNRSEEITLTQENLKDIIEYFNEYIRDEQACLDNVFLDMKETVIRTIHHINSVVLLLVSYIHHINNNHNIISEPIKEYLQLTESMRDIYGVKLIMNFEGIDNIFKRVKKSLHSGETGNIISSSRIILSLLLFDENKKEVCNYIQNIFDSLEYADVSICNKIIASMSLIIPNQIYISNHDQYKFVNSLLSCISRSYEVYAEKRKETFDLLYLISNLTRNYYDTLIKNRIPISEQLEELIKMFKSNKLNEIKNKWYNV